MPKNALALWIPIFILIAIDAVGLYAKNMSLDIKALLLPTAMVLLMVFLFWIYTRVRPNPRIASLTITMGALSAFFSAAAVFSYLLVTLNQPLIDPYLVTADHALGLDWLKMYLWITSHPILRVALKFIYISLVPQMVLLQIVLNFRGDFARSRELVWLIMLSCLGCILLSALLPAAGAFGYFHVNGQEPYLHEFMALRDGRMKMLGTTKMQGVVQFPSFHLALAAIFCYAARGIPVLFPVLLVMNALVILATPAIGGHHFADLWGGIVVTLITIAAVKKIAPQGGLY